MKVKILTESELRRSVGLEHEALLAIEAAFSALADDRVAQPPIMRVDIPEHNGEVDVKTAYIHGEDSFAIKLSSGFFDNYRLGLPSGSGMMILLSSVTGVPRAVLLDNGYLTDVRTALAGAVAARYLAREKIDTVGVVGTGMQARYQLRALRLVRDFNRVLVFGRSAAKLESYIDDMRSALGLELSGVETIAELVERSDVVVTTTPSRSPFLRAEWLHSGLHITAMGSDAEEKQELFPQVLQRADRLVCDRKSQCLRLGELHHAVEAGLIGDDQAVIELGELTLGRRPGRRSEDEITVCDLTGTGVQDTAIALLAYRRAEELGLGLEIEV